MSFPTDDIFEFIDQSRLCDTAETLTDIFQKLLQKNGFDYFVMLLNPVSAIDFSKSLISTTWPCEWTSRYSEKQYCRIDPIVLYTLVKERPFHWKEATRAYCDKKSQVYIADAEKYGLKDGVLFPLYSKSFGRSIISIASNNCFPENDNLMSGLYLASSYFSASISDIHERTLGTARLTDREREVLTWAAAGKTAWETSEILTISERTVQGHLAAARQKLDVATTTQAAAKAFKIGLISL